MLSPDYLPALDVVAGAARTGLLPARVADALNGTDFVLFNVPDDASDTAACSARFAIPLEDGANTIVVRFRKDGGEHFAAVVSLASTRIDVNGATRRALGAQRISFASREEAVAGSGMEYGGITAFGLPPHWPVLIDSDVMTRQTIVMGAGIRRAKLLLAPAALRMLAGATVAALAKHAPAVSQPGAAG